MIKQGGGVRRPLHYAAAPIGDVPHHSAQKQAGTLQGMDTK
jgi:hypothetical protein